VKEERSEQLLELLKKGQITEFNKLRGSGFLSLSGADLRDAILRDADLRGAYLSGADLSDANLTRADLSDADLSGAYLRGAKNMPISKEEARERGAIVD
jgi:uncharacterized protein YjbI with pentapeptide repeats